jgi:hypothetical protein
VNVTGHFSDVLETLFSTLLFRQSFGVTTWVEVPPMV